ncbi:hypothetical protein [Liquorilactobacillus vini]|uniref:hypothetical protein n=1 Tax=Liquorilactobacillus vini TaxID=238015 RepID=UPI00030CE311|nr:hypothetical protein [Liquorilactobacillus vini]
MGAPLLLLGLFFEGFNESFLRPDSFFYQILDLRKWNWLIEFSKAAAALSQICFSFFFTFIMCGNSSFSDSSMSYNCWQQQPFSATAEFFSSSFAAVDD